MNSQGLSVPGPKKSKTELKKKVTGLSLRSLSPTLRDVSCHVMYAYVYDFDAVCLHTRALVGTLPWFLSPLLQQTECVMDLVSSRLAE